MIEQDTLNAFNKISNEIQHRPLNEEPYLNPILNNKNIEKIIVSNTQALNSDQTDRLNQEFLLNGPINQLTQNQAITEIIINGPKNIWYEEHGQFLKHKDYFLSDLTYNNFIHRVCSEAKINISLKQPCANGVWKQFRIHAIQPPLVANNTQITLRRQPKNPWSLSALQQIQWAPSTAIEFLKKVIAEKKNLLFIGPTGSGKTSILNACLREVKDNERIIVIEDTDEVQLPNLISTKLLTSDLQNHQSKRYEAQDLVKEALRMRPERLIMGEVRSAEAKDLMLALSTGHSGSFSTLHASDPKQALWRLELLIQMGAPHWSLDVIRGLIFLSVQYIIYTDMVNKKRQLMGIYKVASLEKFGFTFETVFKP